MSISGADAPPPGMHEPECEDFTTSTDSYGRLRLGEDSIGELTEEDDTET